MRTLTCLLLIALLTTALAVQADPTRPPSPAEIRAWQAGHAGETPRTDWNLQSILISENRRVAIINGRRYQAGDEIRQARIIAIEPGEVVLERDGERFSLTIKTRTRSVRQSEND
jgi:MSHA biogenesis protein MshK